MSFYEDLEDQVAARLNPLTAVQEVLATTSIVIDGGTAIPGTNKVTSITIGGIEVLGADVDWITSHAQTMTNIAAQITSFASVPNWTAAVVDGAIIASSPAGASQTQYNGLAVVVTVGGDVSFTGDANTAGGINAFNVDVEVMPETKKGQQPAIKGRVTILYAKEAGKPNETTDIIDQETDVQVILKIEAPMRRGSAGLYDIIERVRFLILGWKPVCCWKSFTYSDGEFKELKDNTWIYYVIYSTRRVIVQDFNAEAGPVAKKMIFYNPTLDNTQEIPDPLPD
jgi:hypothetical protein